MRYGPRRTLFDVIGVAAIALVTMLGLALWVAFDLVANGASPGPLAVIAIVAAGFALTIFVFHLTLLRPALRLRRRPPSPATIVAHLAHVDGADGVPLQHAHQLS